MMFDNRQVKLDNSVFEYKNMPDVLFSRLCHKQGIPMTILKHNSTYLKYIPNDEYYMERYKRLLHSDETLTPLLTG